jgi:hypothetical protein
MRPLPQDHPMFAETYIDKVSEENPVETLEQSVELLQTELDAIHEKTAELAYAPGKWTVRQVLRHVIDTERIFAYRALCIARSEDQALPSFDENKYAQAADEGLSDLTDLKNEWMLVRRSTVALYKSFPERLLQRSGTAGGARVTVNALAYMILGHWRHHAGLFRDRYGLELPNGEA